MDDPSISNMLNNSYFRCRSTLNLSRKLEKEVVTLQKDKERVFNELSEAQQHVTYLESSYTFRSGRILVENICPNIRGDSLVTLRIMSLHVSLNGDVQKFS